MLAPGGEYYNYSGCGNTLNTNQPVVSNVGSGAAGEGDLASGLLGLRQYTEH